MQNKKPKLCELIGVEPYQHFRFDYPERKYEDCWIDNNGKLWSGDGQPHKVGKNGIYYLIENPEIEILPKKFRMTEKEYKICISLHATRFIYDNMYVILYNDEGKRLAAVNKTLFPSVPSGEKYDAIPIDISYGIFTIAITKDGGCIIL